jgi:hypothetical protein
MCAAVASVLGHEPHRVRQYQIACLLHDLGRAGLDRSLFGKIWSWAKAHGIPTRPREWRAIHPETKYGRETEAFIARYGEALAADGIVITPWAKEQIEMRLGYARRLGRRLRAVRTSIRRMGVRWESWMQAVMLYYYYPEKLAGSSPVNSSRPTATSGEAATIMCETRKRLPKRLTIWASWSRKVSSVLGS